MLLLIMHQVIPTHCVRGPFSATHISFSDQILVRKDGDTKTSVSSTTLVVHENPSTPSSPSPSPSPGLAIIARGTHHSPRRSLNLPSKVKIRHTVLHMSRPPAPSLPSCLPRCKQSCIGSRVFDVKRCYTTEFTSWQSSYFPNCQLKDGGIGGISSCKWMVESLCWSRGLECLGGHNSKDGNWKVIDLINTWYFFAKLSQGLRSFSFFANTF